MPALWARQRSQADQYVTSIAKAPVDLRAISRGASRDLPGRPTMCWALRNRAKLVTFLAQKAAPAGR
jgi:hypothetical protein